MMRKHGWQLPAHTFQVVAITVFCLLAVAYYAFFAPFVGGRIWEYVLIGVYSPVALVVFILYVRCTAINPADPGIMSKFNKGASIPDANKALSEKDMPRKFDETASGLHSSPSTASRSSTAAPNSSIKGSVGDAGTVNIVPRKSHCDCGAILCAVFVYEDCRNQEGADEQQGNSEEALYCTLCNAEVRKFSKHCRSCDKCVDGFDHHCRWLNNCVGRKNYVTFISLMASSLLWLIIEAGVGIAVLVHVFVNKKSMENEIVNRLGNGFSRAPFATVVAVCTAVSILACFPLAELFFFHMLLIKKGITTYEYVVAMRAMSEPPAGGSVDEEAPNIVYSPSGSARSGTTGFSGGSSLGLQYKGAWCTPPRVFVDYQDEVIPHLDPGMVPSTVDPDAAGGDDRGPKGPKKPVKISAWKLAKLDSNEAMRAAAKARASSSVLRPVENHRQLHLPDSELSSSGNMSVRSSLSADTGPNKEHKNDMRFSMSKNSFAPSQGSRDECETGTHSVSSFSSPSHNHESVTLSPLPPQHPLGHLGVGLSQAPSIPDRPVTSKAGIPVVNNPITHHSSSAFDDRILQRGNDTDLLLLTAPAASLPRDVRRTSVVWDQEAGRYVSVPVSATSDARNRSSLPINLQNPSAPVGRHVLPPRGPSSSSSASRPPVPQQEKLMYTGDSIFFGGPLLNLPVRNDSASARDNRERPGLNLPRDTRFKRDSASNQLPVFVPGGYDPKPSV